MLEQEYDAIQFDTAAGAAGTTADKDQYYE